MDHYDPELESVLANLSNLCRHENFKGCGVTPMTRAERIERIPMTRNSQTVGDIYLGAKPIRQIIAPNKMSFTVYYRKRRGKKVSSLTIIEVSSALAMRYHLCNPNSVFRRILEKGSVPIYYVRWDQNGYPELLVP